jgi:hypothetical protein
MVELNSKKYSTFIRVSEETRIIALSDIHADIHSLIISLRDCAEVIRKKPGHPVNLSENIDPELEHLLNIMLKPETSQTESLA